MRDCPAAALCLLLAMLAGTLPLDGTADEVDANARPLPEGALMLLEDDARQLEAERTGQETDRSGAADATSATPAMTLEPAARGSTDPVQSQTAVPAGTDGAAGVPPGGPLPALPPSAADALATTPGQPTPIPAVHGAIREAIVPVQFDFHFLRRLMQEQVFTDQGRARFDVDTAGCNRLLLSDPALSPVSPTATTTAMVRLRARAEARIGVVLLGNCTSVVEWQGVVEVDQVPALVDGAGGFALGVVDSRVLDDEGNPAGSAGAVWGWMKGHVHPRLEATQVDLRGALAELRQLLSVVLRGSAASGIGQVLDSVRVDDARANDNGVRVDVRLAAPVATTAPPEPPLSEAEIARLRDAVGTLDAFLTFVVKAAAGEAGSVGRRSGLLATLLDGRYRLSEALTDGVHGDAAVRSLFVEIWTALAPNLAELPGDLPGQQGLRYLAFIAAGDAVRALDALGPGTGLDLSADGLRRMARLLAPDYEGDPLERSEGVDESLRERFGFGAPLPPPSRDTPPKPPVPAEPDARNDALSPVQVMALVLLPRAARADSGGGTAGTPARLQRLNGWIPSRDDLDDYLARVNELLHTVADAEVASGSLPRHAEALFRLMVPAIAWQESCWRQFVRGDDGPVPLRSPAGAVGIMQVNKAVWRGFYDAEGLARDIAYNARAGAEITRHYLVDYALRAGEQEREGGADNLVRATYAVYNGGPRHLQRYRKPDTPARLRAIDNAFFHKYATLRQGDSLAVRACYGPA